MERRPGWYTWLALLGCAVISPFLSIWASVNIAQRSNCDLYRTQVEVYQETPPSTAAGVRLFETYQAKIRADCGGK